MSRKIGISTQKLQAVYGDRGAIDAAVKVGADAVDFFLASFSVSDPDSAYAGSDEAVVSYFSGIRKYAASRGIEISQTHGRMRIYLNDPALDKACLENARLDLMATAVLGAPVCVMHGVKTATMGTDADTRLMRDLNHEIFTKILARAKEYGVTVAVETSGYTDKVQSPDFFSSAVEFKNSFERIRRGSDCADRFAVCVDTGHVNTVVRFGNPAPADFIRMFKGHVVCLHLNDNDGLRDGHLPPRAGNIDWDGVFDALDEIGYDGVYNLEVNFSRFGKGFETETADFSVRLLRHMLAERYGRKSR